MNLFPTLVVNRATSGAVLPHRIVAADAADQTYKQAAAGADKLLGVSGQIGATAADRIDIHFAGIVPVVYGGNVTTGDLLTSDATGRAVVAAAGNRVIGTAFESGDADTIGSVLIAPSEKAPA